MKRKKSRASVSSVATAMHTRCAEGRDTITGNYQTYKVDPYVKILMPAAVSLCTLEDKLQKLRMAQR
jgi:hypothetical protein